MRTKLSASLALGLATLLALVPLQQSVHADILDVGTQTGTFTGNTRGYWFTAPVDFLIDGIHVVPDASTDNQDVAIVRFNSGAPPLFSSTTNDFTTLFLSQDDSTAGFIGVPNILVQAGDIIGVLGSRGANSTNSYQTAPYNSTGFFGNSVTLTRLGMQFDLRSTAPQDLFQEAGGSISRVELSFTAVPEPGSASIIMTLAGAAVVIRRRRT